MSPSTRVVVTGASGNVGSSLLAELLREGVGVTGISRRQPDLGRAPFLGARWTALDLTRDADLPALREAVRGADAVVHLAWGFQPSHRVDQLAELGVGGTRRVAQAVVAEGVPHLVHMSSVGAYSPRSRAEPVSEDYPTLGVPSSPYSQHKAAAERVLDDVEAGNPGLVVTRMRPGIVGQRTAGSAMARYALPGVVPAGLVRLLPLLPLDRRLQIPVVHSDDVASAVTRALELQAAGPFNLAVDPPVTAETIGRALGARTVHVPARLLRALVAGLWHARIEQLDPGWIDLAYAVPLLDTQRARTELGWRPTHTPADVVGEIVDGLASSDGAASPVLRARSVVDNLRRGVRDGPVDRRPRP